MEGVGRREGSAETSRWESSRRVPGALVLFGRGGGWGGAGVEGNSSRLRGLSCFVESVRIFLGGGGAGHALCADSLPVEGAGTVEELEVEGGGGLAVDLGVRSGHCWGLVVVIKRGMRALIYASMLMQESATDGMSRRWTRDS